MQITSCTRHFVELPGTLSWTLFLQSSKDNSCAQVDLHLNSDIGGHQNHSVPLDPVVSLATSFNNDRNANPHQVTLPILQDLLHITSTDFCGSKNVLHHDYCSCKDAYVFPLFSAFKGPECSIWHPRVIWSANGS